MPLNNWIYTTKSKAQQQQQQQRTVDNFTGGILLRLRHKQQKLHEMARIYFVVAIEVLTQLSLLVQRLGFYALIKTALNFTILRDYGVSFVSLNQWF
jgi:hypothetical protein